MTGLSRRELMALAGVGAGALLLPRSARAAVSASDRRFLFVLASGGWDPTRCFAPLFGHPHASMEAFAGEATYGGIPIVDADERPSVRAFFQDWADQTAVLNGFEVRSITHERCSRLLLTGRADAGGDDWPALLGAGARPELPLATLVCSGPSYTTELTSGVVRVGSSGQLPALLDASAFDESDMRVQELSTASQDALAQALIQRQARLGEAGSDFAQSALRARDHMDLLAGQAGILDPVIPDFDNCGGVWRELSTAIAALASGHCRSAILSYGGWCGHTFDQHANIEMQSTNYEELFQHLNWGMEQLATTPGPAGGSMLDETTVVVLSEMGRHPKLNTQGGKDHWTYTSAMLVGSGVRGGQVVGGFDDEMLGERVDLTSGERSDTGTSLLSGHLGATLLAMGDVDPAEHLNVQPITALFS